MNDNQYYTILTEAGRRKLRDAIANGEKLHLTEIAVGDGAGQPIRPTESMTGLVGEVYRAPITHNATDEGNPTYAILNLVIPVDVGGWYIREAGVFDSEGELIFIGSLPENYKAVPSMGVASDMSVNLIVDIQQADSVSIVVDPSTVLASREWTNTMLVTAMSLHDEDPDAHARLVEKLIQTGNLVDWQQVTDAVSGQIQTHDQDSSAHDELIRGLRESGQILGRDGVTEAMDTAFKAAVEDGRLRRVAKSTFQIYVSEDGDNANDGLSWETAVRTLAAAWAVVSRVDYRHYRLTINLGVGTFDGYYGVGLHKSGYDSLIRVVGQGKDKTTLTGDCTCFAGSVMQLIDLTIQGRVYSTDGTSTWFYGVRLQGNGGVGLMARRGGHIVFYDGDCEIAGDFSDVFRAWEGGSIYCNNRVTISDDVTCDYFCNAYRNSYIEARGEWVNQERVTGRRWNITSGSRLMTRTGSPDTDLPGSLPGITASTNMTRCADSGAADVCATVNADGSLGVNYGIASCSRTGAGTYRVTFLDVAKNTNYIVIPSILQNTSSADWDVAVTERSTTGLTITTRKAGSATDGAFSFASYW